MTGEDNGELVTAAYTLGIAHPPGYPLWCLLGKVFTFVPHGSIAWRVAFMSALLGAACVFLLSLFIIKLTGNTLAGIGGALALAFSKEFWEQSTIAEVYSLNTLFVIGCTLVLFLWYEKRQTYLLYLFAFLYGLSLTNHNTMLLLGPVYVGFVIAVDRRFWERWPRYAACTAIALSALLVYLYLPVRAAANPPVNWGDPSNWENFWEVIQRKQYSLGILSNPRSFAGFGQQFWAFLKLYAEEFGFWLAWVPLAGWVILWQRDRFAFGLLTGVTLASSVGMIIILNFEIDRQSLWLNNVFWIPVYVMAAFFVGIAVDWACQRLEAGRERQIFAVAILTILATLAPLHYRVNDKSNYYFAYDFAHNLLSTLDKDAVFFPSADHATFPVLYLQAVEGLRPDVTIANLYGYPEWQLYRDMPREQQVGFKKIPTKAQEELIENWIIQSMNRPVYFSAPRSMERLPGHQLAQAGLLFRIVRPGEKEQEPFDWDKYSWHTLETKATEGELTADYILGDFYYLRSRALLVDGREALALKGFDIALRAVGENKETLNNIGNTCAGHGLLLQAAQYLERALRIDDDYSLAMRNLGKVRMQQLDYRAALLQWERLVRLDPEDAEAVWYSAECMKHIGWHDDAIGRWEYLLTKTPRDARVYRELGYALLEQKREFGRAQMMFQESLRLDPNQPELQQVMNNPYQPRQGQRVDPENALPGAPELPALPSVAAPHIPQPGLEALAPQVPQVPQF